jgi:hypothetical protein
VTIALADDVVVHRVGGADVANLRLKPGEAVLTPPGVSTLTGGDAQSAADAMRRVYSKARKWKGPLSMGAASAAAIRAAGFDVIADPTPNFPNHARVVHPNGVAGFTDANLQQLAAAFVNTHGH